MKPKMLSLLVSAVAASVLAAESPAPVDSRDALLDIGCLDVTKAPYLADPTGGADCTEAIQRAVNDARDRGLVCFFPEGSYVISDTISCEQEVSKLDRPRHVDGGTQHYWPVHRPMILMGSTRGQRPVLRLSKEAKGFDDPSKPKIAVWIWAQTWFDAPGNVKRLVNRPMIDIVNSQDLVIAQLKAFRPGDFPHLTETSDEVTSEIPSARACALFVRD